MEPSEVCSPQNITVSCTYMHIWTLQPVRVSSFLHGRLSLCDLFFFFHFFFHIFFLFFAFEIYKNRLCTICRSHSFQNPFVWQQRVHMRINYSKRNFFKAPFILWKGTHGKVSEINIPTPLGPLSCLFVRSFFNYYYYFIFSSTE